MEVVKGAGNNSARVIKHSISPDGIEMLTFELTYWRAFHSEFMTHRLLSKNSSSTRAIPIERAIEIINENPGMPSHWGQNNPGMQSNAHLSEINTKSAKALWRAALDSAVSHVKILASKNGINGHKQWVGRLLEPWSVMKVVVSGTEWNNLYALRNHPDAQPEFQDLVRCMIAACEASTPQVLKPGAWHLPYIVTRVDSDGNATYWVDENTEVDLETARKVSASCCAQVSYRRLDASVEKALDVFNKLNIGVKGKLAHASPVEHQATPMSSSKEAAAALLGEWESGVTHMRRDKSLWSGNLRGWVQYRQLIENEAVW